MTDDSGSRSRHPSRLGPRSNDDDSTDETDKEFLDLVEEDARQSQHTLAWLYRRAKEKGLIKPGPRYT